MKGSENIDLYRLKENSHELKLVSIKLSHGLQNKKNQIRFRKKVQNAAHLKLHIVSNPYSNKVGQFEVLNFNHHITKPAELTTWAQNYTLFLPEPKNVRTQESLAWI